MSHDLIEEYLAKTKNPVQLVKHFDEVPESKIAYPLIGQIKYDGVYILIVVSDGTVRATVGLVKNTTMNCMIRTIS
ncbi:DNA ligase [Acinetobacter phage TCUAN2]|nr:DNA ligase [Acinetobacter phage TCUAN2]